MSQPGGVFMKKTSAAVVCINGGVQCSEREWSSAVLQPPGQVQIVA